MRKMLTAGLLILCAVAFAQNKTYYVANTGKDQNPGTLDKPWRTVTPANKFNFEPGDRLLFKGGQSGHTYGTLQLQNHDFGLTVKSYDGVATLTGIYAYNVGEIVIDTLDLKGPGATGNNISGIDFYMDSLAPGDLNNITIQNVTVSNFGNNGIVIGSWTTADKGYNNVKVLNSSVYDNGRDGLATYGYNHVIKHTNLYVKNVKAYRNYGRLDVTTTNTGSGFVIGGFNGGIIEYCEAYENGKNNRATGGGPQGFWCYDSKNIIFQYSVSHHNKAGRIYDGGGFDIDGGSQNCIIQYCYSYDNDGAGYAFFENGSPNQFDNNIIRYNISQNDGRANAHGAIMMWANYSTNRVKNSQIYNNTIYVKTSPIASLKFPVGVYFKGSNFQNISLYNNIIYTTDTIRTLTGNIAAITFSNNDYFNPHNTTVTYKLGGVNVDPLFVNAGGGKEGYVLKAASPMIDAGKASPGTVDIIGTPVPQNGSYDIGAYESKFKPPVANAGADKTVTLPANSTTLAGSGTDADGTITGYSWTKTAGPAQFTINTPTAATTTVSNLIEGTYTFRLTVTDNDGAARFDDVQVVVSAAPPPAGTKFVKVNIFGGTNPYTNAEWNNWNVTASRTVASLKYSNGTTSAAGAFLSASSGLVDNSATYGGTMAPPEVLRYTTSSSTERTLTFSGLSASKKYNLELYASRSNTGNSTIFTIGTTSVTIVTDNNKTNKASFFNLVPSATGQLVVNMKNSASFNYLNGFILTEMDGTTTSITQARQTGTETIAVAALDVQAFPNPATGYFNLSIRSRSMKPVAIRILDALGRTIENQRIAPNTTVPVGRTYLPGIYYAEVIQENRKATVRLVKGKQE
jgi:hypothetical protein